VLKSGKEIGAHWRRSEARELHSTDAGKYDEHSALLDPDNFHGVAADWVPGKYSVWVSPERPK